MKFRTQDEFWEHEDLGLIPNGWKVEKLFCVSDIMSGGTPSTKENSFWDGNISWITPKDLSGYSRKFISKGERNITEEGLKKSSAKLVPKGTVLLTSRAPIGYVVIAENECTTNQGFKNVICSKKLLNEYLYYYFKINKDRLESLSNGSTFKELSGTSLKEFETHLPEMYEQIKIAEILSSIDDKIESLDNQNKLLNNLGMKLFEKYFVRFKDFKGELIWNDELEKEVPKEWKVVQLKKFIKFQKGKKPLETFQEKKENFMKQILIETLDGNPSQYVNPKGLIIAEKYDLIMVMDGASSGRLEIGFDGAIGSTLAKIEVNNISQFYIYYSIFSFVDQIKNNTTGSAIPHTDKSFVLSKYILEPKEELIILFDKEAKEILDKIFENKKQIETLTKLRDKLLPMLISGKIKV